MIDNNVMEFIERSGVRFRHGMAIALIIDANRENDREQVAKNLAEAQGLLDASSLDWGEEEGSGVRGQGAGGDAGATVADRVRARMGVKPKLSKPRSFDLRPRDSSAEADQARLERAAHRLGGENGDTRRVNVGAHYYTCTKCGERKHATGFFKGNRETCRFCLGEAKKETET